MSTEAEDWIKLDLHIHTLDDPKDKIDYSAHQLLERARSLGFRVLAITLHDVVFDRPEVFADATAMGILLIPAAEMRLEGADVVLLNVRPHEVARLRTFNDLRKLRAERGDSLFTFAPHPFYVLGGSIGDRLLKEMDCFDGIEWCHFYKGWFNPNRRAASVAKQFDKSLIATSDAHRLHAFGSHYTSIHARASLRPKMFFGRYKRSGPPNESAIHSGCNRGCDLLRFIRHPLTRHRHHSSDCRSRRLEPARNWSRQS